MKFIKFLFGRNEIVEETPQTPRLIDLAFQHGYAARERKDSKHTCPYRKGTVLHQYWERGWDFAEQISKMNER